MSTTVRSITVEPAEFTLVDFDPAEIADIAAQVADLVGLPADLAVKIVVDETTPQGRARLGSVDPVVIEAESGAFEDARRPRQMDPQAVWDVVGRLLYRAADRTDPGFGDPPPEGELSLEEATAWDAASMGRLARRGASDQRDRRLYHFRIRHGFNDVADALFDHLWGIDVLQWHEIKRVCETTAPIRSKTPIPKAPRAGKPRPRLKKRPPRHEKD